jgi:potassium-dependent mechanosensitive channel
VAQPNRGLRKIRIASLLLLLLVVSALPVQARKQPARKPQPVKKAPPAPALPAAIQLASGETIPVSELVPRTESATQQIGQIAASIHTPEMRQVETSLDVLSQAVSNAYEDTKNNIRLARSPLQLTETKVLWVRNRTQLDGINLAIVRYATSLDQQSQQLNKLRETWSAAAKSVVAAKLPDEFVQRVLGVQQLTEQAQRALREETERLLKVQVQLSQTRTQVDDVVDQLDLAEASLRDQLFVIDSPPIWRVLHPTHFRGTWDQITRLLKGAGSRARNFYEAYRSKLLVYSFCNLVLFIIIVRFSRQDRTTWPVEDAALTESLRHPIALTAFVMLLFFGLLFSKAPSEVLRTSRLLMVLSVIYLATRIFDQRLRRHVVALGLFTIVNVVSVLFTSGTVLRRVVVLLVTGAMLAGMVVLLRKGGMVRTLLEERRWNFVAMCCFIAGAFLSISTLSNIIGNVSLGDLLANGTIVAAYTAVAVYVFYIVFTALTYAFTSSTFGQKSRAIHLHRDLIDRRLATTFKRIAWFLWIAIVLYAFQALDQTIAEISAILHYKLQVGTVSLSLLDVVLFFLVLYVSTLTARLIRFLLNEEILPRTSINPGAAQAGSRLTYTGLLFVGIFIAFGAAGLELSKLTVLTGAFGVGIGFGLQNVVNNFVSGIIVSLERPVQVGDFVEVGTLFGEIRTIGFRSSTVRTPEGADVIVPNSELISKSVVNWSLTDFYRRTDVSIGAAYGTDPNRVLNILTRIANSHPGVVPYPPPLITFDQFGDSSLNFTMRFWSKLDVRLQIRSEINVQIAEEFEKDGIQIPFPQRDVHLFMEGATPSQELPAAVVARASQAAGQS